MYYKSIESQVGRLCTILSLIFGFSVTSRRGPPTSRRQNYISLSRRDVDLPRRDVKITCLCHVATWTSHVATSFFDPLCHVATWTHTSRRQNYKSLSRRDVDLPRRDVDFTPLCYVATWIYTSRRELVQVSVMSRRGPERRDVTLHVAKWPCFKAKNCSFLVLHLAHLSTETLTPSRTIRAVPCRSSLSPWSETPPLLTDH